MIDLAKKIEQTAVAPGEIAIFWLGQAGFLIKDENGRRIVIDPYLSDAVERMWGFKRLMAPLLSPGEIDADVYIATHLHEDHFDIDSAPEIMQDPKTALVCSTGVAEKCAETGLGKGRVYGLAAGDCVTLCGMRFTAVFGDHGELAPDAIGLYMEVSGIGIYFTGDTAYQPEEMLQSLNGRPVDILIACINGEFGNMNGTEAAMLAGKTKCRVAIPCHYWTFAVHRGDPLEFMQKMPEYAPECAAKMLCQGEGFTFSKPEAIR